MAIEEAGRLSRHVQPAARGLQIDTKNFGLNLVSNWPIFPVPPIINSLHVNDLTFFVHHGMEEVIGSIPIRSTN